MTAASIYAMLRSMSVIITCILSIIFLKRVFYRHHWTAVGFIVCGVFFVGIAALLWKDSTHTSSSQALGIFLLVIAQLFAGGMYVTEEKLLSVY